MARRSQPPSLTAVDLFAGAGGLSLGLTDAGYDVVGAVELDPLAAETYRLNHRDTVLWECDIRELGSEEMLDTLGLEKGSWICSPRARPARGSRRCGPSTARETWRTPATT